MEIKKSPKADLENKKSTSILIGLVVALGIMFIAFEWSQRDVVVYEEAIQSAVVEDEEMIEVTFREETPPPPAPEPPAPETVLSDVIEIKDNTEEVETVDFSAEDDASQRVVVQAPVAAPVEEEEEQQIFVVVEKMPEFPGGEEAMRRYLARNIRYPLIAQENGIQGRVICQFVVNADGKIVDVQVVRGVEASLDAEAVRVIQSMPSWTPGKQGGKSVRVKYTLPIRFKL
ncbi:MAG: TonB family protein [Bacteroidetes bacterium]|uniref:TonB family protein n=1 Tax=Candidatus Enterocola intestinipullorum TaxID=2840783 RepID=A0A9D9HEZ8_9BACT|nr:TonB family protein [Candidatus Enterocola intestinipullorum]